MPHVLVQGVVLVGEVGDEELGKAVAVDVLGVDAHARLRLAVHVVGGARELGGVVEGAVAAVEEEEVRVHVVGDVEVDQAVVVEVGRHHAEAVAVVADLGIASSDSSPWSSGRSTSSSAVITRSKTLVKVKLPLLR